MWRQGRWSVVFWDCVLSAFNGSRIALSDPNENVSSEIETRLQGVLEEFYAMVVFGLLSGRQIDLIVNLGNLATTSASLTRTRERMRAWFVKRDKRKRVY